MPFFYPGSSTQCTKHNNGTINESMLYSLGSVLLWIRAPRASHCCQVGCGQWFLAENLMDIDVNPLNSLLSLLISSKKFLFTLKACTMYVQGKPHQFYTCRVWPEEALPAKRKRAHAVWPMWGTINPEQNRAWPRQKSSWVAAVTRSMLGFGEGSEGMGKRCWKLRVYGVVCCTDAPPPTNSSATQTCYTDLHRNKSACLVSS